MFADFLDLITFLFGCIILFIGVALFLYGMHGSTVKGFDKSVSSFCMITGGILIAVMVSLYMFGGEN
ncbi:MAG: hypothetical protein QNK23_12105 [Crocinitomicaceae bacterium]|nr:hypothetical protein [Crocinitomicaceae bacterium]